jgi:hypothetical protein
VRVNKKQPFRRPFEQKNCIARRVRIHRQQKAAATSLSRRLMKTMLTRVSDADRSV